MRVTRAMVRGYIDCFNKNVSEDKRVKLREWSGSYHIVTLDGGEVYTGMTIREAYMCVRGMLHAIGKLK